jgi:hypothetical protein
MKTRARRVARWVVLVLTGDVVAALLFYLATLFAGTASANGMRCENKLVQPGDTQYEVKSLCGPPDDIQQRTESRRVQRAVQRPCPTGQGFCSVVVDDIVEIVVDEWTYDFGPQRFLQYLTFEGGKLTSVRSGPYGRKQP